MVRNHGGTQMNSPTHATATAKQEAQERQRKRQGGQRRPLKRAICLGGGGPAAGLHIGALEGLEANGIKFKERDIWALSCIGAWVGVIYNQAKADRELEETYNFFRGVFRENKSFKSFPTNTIFAPDWGGNAEAIWDFLLEPSNYKNAFLPREIMKSFMHTMSALRGISAIRRRRRRQNGGEFEEVEEFGEFSEGDFNRWIFNDVLAVNPAVRFLTAMTYKSEVTGLARLYYPDSKFLNEIKFKELEKPEKPFIFHNAWNLSMQDLQLFSNRDPSPPSNDEYKRITPQSLCACSALPFVEQTVVIDGDIYCEGALKDTLNFFDLLKDHNHPPDDPLDEIWISRIVDADQVRAPKDLLDSLGNLCQLFAATVGEDDVKLFIYRVREGNANKNADAFKGTIVGIPTSSDITYEWSHRNLEACRRNGRAAAQAAFEAYMAAGGPQPYGKLRIIGEDLRTRRREAITEARRAGYGRS
jgi:predicted acylesterase/phospholipase RssA